MNYLKLMITIKHFIGNLKFIGKLPRKSWTWAFSNLPLWLIVKLGFRSLKDELTYPIIKGCAMLVIAGSKMPFTFQELDVIQNYLDEGGRILVLLSEGSSMPQSNINIFLEKYGIFLNSGILFIWFQS